MKKFLSILVIVLSALVLTAPVSAQVRKKRRPVQKKAVIVGSDNSGAVRPCTPRKTSEGVTYLVGAGKLSSQEKKRLKTKGLLWIPAGETERAKEIRKEAEKRGAALLAKINKEVDQWKTDNPTASAEEVEKRRREKIEQYEEYLEKFRQDRVKLPQFDWRKILNVGPVMNQGKCDLCWAFAATAAASCSLQKNYFDEYMLNSRGMDELSLIDNPGSEMWYFITYGLPHVPRSHVQDLLNCTDVKKSFCEMGWHGEVFDFMVYKDGIPAGNLKNIPEYKQGLRSACSPAEGFIKAHTWNYVNSPVDQIPEPQQLKEALITHGPIATPMFTDDCFGRYKSGVFNERSGVFDAGTPTESRGVDHVVLIIGWDDTKGEKGAWLIKNSWGKEWGEGGFAWIEYGSNNIGLYSAWIDVDTDMSAHEFF